ncbi:AIPR family protein [Dickeya dadantii]|uniref:AIPR family protein n=1 Tax=Dickeya dadantii TaxID=204038 RepID=UPI0025432093|nr:AIPR family protein [Dickeya dadantii]
MHHIGEFNKHTALKEKYGSNAYMLWVLGLYLDEPDFDVLAARSLTDGSNDKCLDFIEVDKTGQKIVIAQGYFSEKSADKAPSKKASDLIIAGSWLAYGNENATTMNDRVRTRTAECRLALDGEEIDQIEFLYIHNRPESVNTQEELDTCTRTAERLFENYDLTIICKEFGLREVEKLYLERSSQILVKEEIRIDGKKMGEHRTSDWDAYLFTVKGSWLRDLFKEYDDRLFSANYRGFLGINKRKKINSSIKSTAEKQSNDFWVFNNGITLLTSELLTSGNKSSLKGISIINGAQTTGSLGSVDTKIDLSNVEVMCRVVVCKNPNKIEEIVKYNNTQNRITTWDQYANDDMQVLIRNQFFDLGHEYSLKRGFDSAESSIGIEKAAQPVLSFNGHYVDANRSKNSIFDRPEIYKRAFSDRSARHILLAFCFAKSIDEVKRSLMMKETRTDNEEKQLSLFNYLSFRYFLLASIGACLQQFVGGNFSPENAKISSGIASESIPELSGKLEKITRQVLRSVSRCLDNKVKSDRVDIGKLLRNESTLGGIRSELNSFLESVLDGQLDESYQEIISIEF